MTAYRLEVQRDVNKQLQQLPPVIADGIRKVLRDLAKDPAHQRFDLKRIQGHSSRPPTLRLRIGQYRALLKISEERQLVRILRIGHRSSVYRGLEHLDEGVEETD